MNKPEIVKAFATKYKYTQKEAGNLFDEIIEFVTDMLASGETLEIYGLMQLGTKVQKSKKCVNPNTLEKMTSKEKRIPYCKFGKPLKRAIK